MKRDIKLCDQAQSWTYFPYYFLSFQKHHSTQLYVIVGWTEFPVQLLNKTKIKEAANKKLERKDQQHKISSILVHFSHRVHPHPTMRKTSNFRCTNINPKMLMVSGLELL